MTILTDACRRTRFFVRPILALMLLIIPQALGQTPSSRERTRLQQKVPPPPASNRGRADRLPMQAAASQRNIETVPSGTAKRSRLGVRRNLFRITNTESGFRIDASATAQFAGGLCTQPGANCQAPNADGGFVSDITRFKVADDFTPSTNGNVTEICWSGGYFDFARGQDCSEGAADAFRIIYFDDAGGVPGSMIGVFQQANFNLDVTGPVWTGGFIAGQTREFEYTATHIPLVNDLIAGQCYWVEITNSLTQECSWLWELSTSGNGRSLQDGDGIDAPNGYDLPVDALPDDLSFCLDLPLGDSAPCVPPGPPNDRCADAEILSTTGLFPFDNIDATTDGRELSSCQGIRDIQVASDLWYCWTAPMGCTDEVFVSTCGTTNGDVDTMIAVYDGCGTCPPTSATLITCNDDRCGELADPVQSMAKFDAVAGQSYLIRLGTFPGEPRGSGNIRITCGPPNNIACPGSDSCLVANFTPGCTDERCCETVCACDSFCCEVFWDEGCATLGFVGVDGEPSTCGAGALCVAPPVCGDAGTGACCSANGTGFCSDAACCELVTACDPFCKENWDEACATTGSQSRPGCGAQSLCQELCPVGQCPSAGGIDQIEFIDPPNFTVDARQPHPPGQPEVAQGIREITLNGPTGADASCFSLCEPATTGAPNEIVTVVENSGTYLLTLAKPLQTDAVTTITYTDGNGVRTVGQFSAHPGNVNADSRTSGVDIAVLFGIIEGDFPAIFDEYSSDTDHSGTTTPADVLRIIDLLNGADGYKEQLGVRSPTIDADCPMP